MNEYRFVKNRSVQTQISQKAMKLLKEDFIWIISLDNDRKSEKDPVILKKLALLQKDIPNIIFV
ncbi:hypothetical protein, partial [Desulfobacula sp.]|uniref:hypothetical protein n=1 Tax=Desulfobacula sp. TaxID=2593537 RepID=UPI0039B8D9D9